MRLKFKFLFFWLILTISFSVAQNQGAIRGVWLTNVDSDVLMSKQNIKDAVARCKRLGFNTIFVVTWNKGVTLFKSPTLKNVIGLEIDPVYGDRDPIRELIEEAHKENISVHGWFEFGFSSSYKLNGGKLIEAKPHWAAIDTNGNLVSKNNFEWMNGLHPEVQDFMLNIIMDLVENYDIDGIQGDDRLPAMPCEGGYDEYTTNLYKAEHNGEMPPRNCKDTLWTDWRAKKLNLYMERIYKTVKTYNKKIVVSMAPSIFPWAKEEYLQDWPEWLKNGLIDFVCPQNYRYDINRYRNELKIMVKEQVSKENLNRLFPGILLKLSNYYPSKKFLKSMIEENRKYGINGEVFFFYEGLKKFENFFRETYKKNVKLPVYLDK